MALDVSQAQSDQVVYIEDRDLFVEVARGVGIAGIVHTDYATTRKSLEGWGLTVSDGDLHSGPNHP